MTLADELRDRDPEWLAQRVRQLEAQLVNKERELQESRAAQRRTHRELKSLRETVTQCEEALVGLRESLAGVIA